MQHKNTKYTNIQNTKYKTQNIIYITNKNIYTYILL